MNRHADNRHPQARRSVESWAHLGQAMVVLTCVAWATAALARTYIEPVSRRLVGVAIMCMRAPFLHALVMEWQTNLPYALWTVAYNLFHITAMLLVELSWGVQAPATSKSALRDLNGHGLALFLVANVLTGAVNLSIDTIHQPAQVAYGVLAAYVVVILGLASFLRSRSLAGADGARFD